jgi:hypothetical protein
MAKDTSNTSTSANQALLQERLKKLNQKDFEWSAWKKGTLLVLEKIFGPGSMYVKDLSNTDYHYNSWSLRDTAGSEDPVKASMRELLQICLTDVSNRSQSETPETNQGNKEEARVILKQFLDNATLTQIKNLINSETPEMIKEEKLNDLIKAKLPKHHELLLGKLLLWIFN